MTSRITRPITRRTFLSRVGKGTVALAVVGIAGCVPSSGPAPSGVGGDGNSSGGPGPAPPATPGSVSPDGTTPSASGAAGEGVAWERVDLGFVSAYVLVRGGEAAVVDTGVSGSDDEIAAALDRLGLDWGAVGHVVFTHQHSDHAGSATAVLAAAPDARAYAGAADIPAIRAPRPLIEVADGDDVFGLRIVATPGHTAGHISVLDEVGGILVAGDALNTQSGAVTGPNPAFSADMTVALASVDKLAALRFETLLVGHGDPITEGASALVAALADGS